MNWFTDSVAFKQALMRFFFETFFELVICASVGFKLYEIRSIWNRPDKIAFSLMMVMILISAIFLVLFLRFVCCV